MHGMSIHISRLTAFAWRPIEPESQARQGRKSWPQAGGWPEAKPAARGTFVGGSGPELWCMLRSAPGARPGP